MKKLKKLSNLQLAYIAGFFEARRFGLQGNGKTISTSFNWQMAEVVERIAGLVGGTVIIGEGLTFAERFSVRDRPAVFTDGKSPRIRLTVRGKYAQRLIKMLLPYLSNGARSRFKPLLNKKIFTQNECGKMGRKHRKDGPRFPCGKLKG